MLEPKLEPKLEPLVQLSQADPSDEEVSLGQPAPTAPPLASRPRPQRRCTKPAKLDDYTQGEHLDKSPGYSPVVNPFSEHDFNEPLLVLVLARQAQKAQNRSHGHHSVG